ncbi:MAG: proteasome assembly chaperone family protein [Theionarchaea archaeon]|nr:MAG: proteasome assembly chaperone family protein [Theionarchaea archaeon DG-70-1]MBU7027853.1 proteasome assembly chaperone family protein [Theionarchaea archaeon]
MKESVIWELKKVDLQGPVLIEGLPGIGLIGKLAADHLISELHAEKFAELYSPHFTHQAVVEPDSTVRPMRNEFYYWKGKDLQLIILVGDTQPQPTDSYGHYEVVGAILDYVEQFGTKTIFTLGGSSTGGQEVKTPRVFGAATDRELVKKYRNEGVTFKSDPGSAIVGASGLLLSLGQLRGMSGVCLLGESPGYLVIDARSAKSVLEVLTKILGIKMDMSELEKRAQETEQFIKKVQDMEKKQRLQQQLKELGDFGYIR